MKTGQPAIGVLDGLRGLAALIVVASHAGGLGLHLIPGLPLTGAGKYGVYLFFVLSAYLLTAQWCAAWAVRAVDGAYLRRYLLRRVLRIYPLYALVLIVGWLLAPRGLGVPLDGAAVWRHLSLQEGRDLYWSIPVEFLFYLIIPPLSFLLALQVRQRYKTLMLLMVLALTLWAWPPNAAPLNSTWLPYYLPIFLCGSFAACWLSTRRHASFAPVASVSVWDGLLLLALLASVPAVFIAIGLAAQLDSLHRAFLGWGLLWSVVLLGLLSGRLPAWYWLLDRPFWRACGRWCFSLYLLHMPALYVAKRLPVSTVLQAWLGLALALALAAAAYRFIERPAMQLGRRA